MIILWCEVERDYRACAGFGSSWQHSRYEESYMSALDDADDEHVAA